jgi:type I restriction-modification system DNA methylase subunit
VPEPVKITLNDLQAKFSMLDFLMNQEQTRITTEMEVSVKAGELVGIIYDALYKQYINPESEKALKSLNMLCVRLVFCLYAEDAGIFGNNHHMFHDYLQKFDAPDVRKALIELFKILDTKQEDRDPYDVSDLSKFPYVNGGLFADENIEIPHFTEEIKHILLANASDDFDWSVISPTIFGAVFESTLNPETRRSGGMHYTSIENIHKVIDPLFLEDLQSEFEDVKKLTIEKTRTAKLKAFQGKLADLKWLDPACGSGNFLTETYISIRRLENKVLQELQHGQIVFGEAINPIQVSINQFYGIEINDFAVTVAKTALWIAESQMMKETEDIVHMNLDFLPLKTNAFITEGNALQLNWETLLPKGGLSYIIGNPPFVGARWMNKSQKEDILSIFGKKWKGVGDLDYVCAWYKKCSDLMKGTNIRASLVSTNSITQGSAISNIWKPLFEDGLHFDFAYRTFRWDSEAKSKAKVHCVIIGFSHAKNNLQKYIYDNGTKNIVSNINGYLLGTDSVFIEKRMKPISDVPSIALGGASN